MQCSSSCVPVPLSYNSWHIQWITYCLCIMQPPQPCFFKVLIPAAKSKIGSDNPLWPPQLRLLNEHIQLLGGKLIPVIPESNGSSKEFSETQSAKKMFIRLGLIEELESWHGRADDLLPPNSRADGGPAQSGGEWEGPNLPLALLLQDTAHFRRHHEAIEFSSAAGSWLQMLKPSCWNDCIRGLANECTVIPT